MSPSAQESLLFELLFDADTRARFAKGGVDALERDELGPEARADFAAIRVDALELDARMRRSMVLSQLCVQYTLTFSVLSSTPGGFDVLDALVDVRTMRTPPIERPVVFGRRLREELAEDAVELAQLGCQAVLEAELGMCWTAASIRCEMLDLGQAPRPPATLAEDWLRAPLRIPSFVSAALLPVSRQALREALCPVPDRALYRHLAQSPTSADEVNALFARGEPSLLVARAEIDRRSHCEPTASHRVVEVSEGFGELLGHFNGERFIADMLDGLRAAGGSEAILVGVRSGFEALVAAGMLEAAR